MEVLSRPPHCRQALRWTIVSIRPAGAAKPDESRRRRYDGTMALSTPRPLKPDESGASQGYEARHPPGACRRSASPPGIVAGSGPVHRQSGDHRQPLRQRIEAVRPGSDTAGPAAIHPAAAAGAPRRSARAGAAAGPEPEPRDPVLSATAPAVAGGGSTLRHPLWHLRHSGRRHPRRRLPVRIHHRCRAVTAARLPAAIRDRQTG
jgi:hypothetical protein